MTITTIFLSYVLKSINIPEEEQIMKFSCSREHLHHAVQTVQKAVAAKTPLPILTGIYLSAKNNTLELQATDYEIGISCTIDAQISQPGDIVVSGRYLQELVRRLPGQTVEIDSGSEGKTVRISSDRSQFNLLTMPAEEFPVLKRIIPEKSMVVNDSVLRDLIRKTVFACATDEARPIFTGGLLEADDKGIRMVATNTHRLALRREPGEGFAAGIKVIVPAKILNELARILSADDPLEVTMSWQKNQVSFSFGTVYIVSRVIEGQFPDYNKVIPSKFETRVTMNTDMLLAAVERMSLITREGDYNIIKFYFSEAAVTITSNNPEIGTAQETIEAEMDGGDVEIAFNARYVTDILKNIDSEKLVFSLNSSLSPASVTQFEDDKYIYIVTPVRTG